MGQPASLSVIDLVVDAGTVATITVSGEINGDATNGYTVQLELVPLAEAVGSVTFMLAPPNDIAELGDPWPDAGQFSPYDTDQSGMDLWNGAIGDNGTFVAGPVTFAGPLAAFPIMASPGAHGNWAVRLTTSAGDSAWELLSTSLNDGTISVVGPADVPVASYSGLVAMTLLLLAGASLFITCRHDDPFGKLSNLIPD